MSQESIGTDIWFMTSCGLNTMWFTEKFGNLLHKMVLKWGAFTTMQISSLEAKKKKGPGT